MSRTVKRPYRSPLRSTQARQTRARLMDAAQRLFAADGYAATSIAAIAAEAAVAADTVYAVFGSKRNLLKQLMDRAVAAGEEDVPVLQQPEAQRVRRQPDQRQVLAGFAAGVSQRVEAARPIDDILRSAAAVDAEVAALRDDVQLRQRRGAMNAVAGWLAERGPLRDGLGIEEAGAIIWTLTSPEVHRLLRDQCGWSAPRYARWLGETLAQALLVDDRPGTTGD